MSEEPSSYGPSRTLAARNALEDTIRAELTPEEVARLGGVVAYAEREGMTTEEVFRVLCRVNPALSQIPQKLDEKPRTGGQVIEAQFGDIRLTDQQAGVAAAVIEGVDRNLMLQTVGGLAGCGKSVLVSYLRKQFPTFAVCAYTGKAAHVLRKKGVLSASTIHSLIYEPYEDRGTVHWRRRTDFECEGVIIDEASMVGEQIYGDLSAFNVPLIFVGDHGQLEPIGDGDFNLMRSPQHTLTEIHRNAGPIAWFAERLRNDEDGDDFDGGDQVLFARRNLLSKTMVLEADQIIVPFNRMRAAMNANIRKAMGLDGSVKPKERIICLRNNRDEGLFNGMQGFVDRVWEDKPNHWLMDFHSDDGRRFTNIWFNPKTFGQVEYEIDRKRGTANPFDFAYAITCHRAQGSEWDTVLVVAQRCQAWEWRRWAYTAASRAKRKLIWAT